MFAEVDVNAGSGQRQALLIRPQVPLQPATRYIIALVGLRDPAGRPIEAAPFIALRDRQPLNQALAALADRYEDIFAALGSAGVARDSLTLAWDVITASADDATGHVVGMRDTALAMVDSLTWTITATTDTGSDPDRLREVVGTFQVPSFLTDDSLTGTLNTDASGDPVLRGIGSANFVVDIPQCAGSATGPLPVQVFGHGLFGDAQTLRDALREAGRQLPVHGADRHGLDRPVGRGRDHRREHRAARPEPGQPHHRPLAAGARQRAGAGATVPDPDEGRPGVRHQRQRRHRWLAGLTTNGISDGGIQGTTFMALSEDVSMGVLNVPGCEWSTMILRSSDFDPLFVILQQILPDPLDEQILLAMFQVQFDTTDGASFAGHILRTRCPARHRTSRSSCRRRSTTRRSPTSPPACWSAPSACPGWTSSSRCSAYPADRAAAVRLHTVGRDADALPAGDTPSPMDNGAHEAIRQLTLLEQQLQAFFTPTGMVTQTCTGPCVCSLPENTCVSPPGLTPQ